MPCFSAQNRSFEQRRSKTQIKASMQTRPRTVVNRSAATNEEPQTLSGIPQQCEHILHVRGYLPTDLRAELKGTSASQVAKDAKPSNAYLGKREFSRLRNAAKIVTLEDRLEALAKHEAETNYREEEAKRMRRHFQKIDAARLKKQEEAKKKEQEDLFGAKEQVAVLERAFLAKHEQEEEVKKINRIILNAKCHAVRDAQIQEKTQIDQDFKNDESRLQHMVLSLAQESLAQEDAKYEDERVIKAKYATEIRAQLMEREALRFMEAERIEEEARIMREAVDAYKRDEERRQQVEHERRMQFRGELNRISEMSTYFKKLLCDQERDEDMRVAAYMREKEQHIKEMKMKQKVVKDVSERKQQRIYNLAQKLQESQNVQEEMAYIRDMESNERKYRLREKEALENKKRTEMELVDARDRQMQEVKHRQALQIARDEQDFKVASNITAKEDAKRKAVDEQRERNRICYREDIIRQITDKEIARRRAVERERREAIAAREAERQRERNIRAILNAKLAAMREACLPDKYIKEVEKQLRRLKLEQQPEDDIEDDGQELDEDEDNDNIYANIKAKVASNLDKRLAPMLNHKPKA